MALATNQPAMNREDTTQTHSQDSLATRLVNPVLPVTRPCVTDTQSNWTPTLAPWNIPEAMHTRTRPTSAVSRMHTWRTGPCRQAATTTVITTN